MTRYHLRTTKGLRKFLNDVNNGADKTLWENWLTGLNDKVKPNASPHFNKLVDDVQTAKKTLKSQQNVRSRRLGLRAAGIDPRGAYGIPAKDKGGGGHYADYSSKVELLLARVVDILTHIKTVSNAHLEALDRLLLNNPDAGDALRDHVLEFRNGLYGHLSRVVPPGNPPGGSFFGPLSKLLPDGGGGASPVDPANSSYWPSSFIASSSSSSSTPP